LLKGREIHSRTPLYVNAGRWVYESITDQGIAAELDAAGVRIVTDTCTYNTPILGEVEGLVMTNSAKWAWYAPRNIGVDVLFADLDACIDSAVEGKVSAYAGF
jgi:predicted aconitase